MVVTSPSPAAPPAAAPGRPHPTYTNMITYALAQLGGASGRSAIAGFIAACFTGLPVSHDALLSAHLRRLVAEGVLCTSGFSYFFSSDEPIDSATRSLDLDSDDQSGSGFILSTSSSDDDDDDAAYTPLMHVPTSLSLLGEKRGRGRPRKNVEVSPAKAGDVRRGRGRPRKVVVTLSGSGSGSGESMSPEPFAAKGEPTEHSVLSGDAVTKPGRGRPRKKLQQVGDPSTGGGAGIIIKRGPGRPTKEEDQQSQEAKPPPTPTALSTGGVKTEQQSEEEEEEAAAAQHPPTPLSTGDAPETGAATPAEETGGAASTGIKRGRGRPRKEKPAAAAMSAGSAGIKRGRGRPRKEKPAAAAMSAEAGDAGSAGIKRRRGRPRKEKPAAAALLAETEAGDAVSTGMKGALENPISVYAVSTGTNAALENPRTAAGDIVSMVMKRGRGRPRKEQPAFD